MTVTNPTAQNAPEDLTEEWCTVLAASERSVPFQHPAFQIAWLDSFGARAAYHVVTVRDAAGRLQALAPFVASGDRLTLGGDPEIFDYMDIAVAAGADDSVYGRLLDAVAALPWRELALWGLPEGCRTLRVLPELARQRGWTAEEDFEAVCPRVPLPEDWDAYLATLGKKDRHELRRKMRRFQEAGAGMQVARLSAPEEVRAGLDDFIHLHTISRHDKRQFMTPQMEAFFRRMAVDLAAYGLVRLFFVELDGRRVAGLLAFDTGSELLLYNSGYDPAYSYASVGLVSKALTLQAAIAEGKAVFDFMRGAEPYKYDMGAKDLEVHTLTISRPAPP